MDKEQRSNGLRESAWRILGRRVGVIRLLPVSTLSAGLLAILLAFLLVGGVVYALDPPPIVINEIQYHPLHNDHGEEYVELYNNGSVTVSLGGWYFSDGFDYTSPATATIAPGGYAVVGQDPLKIEALYGISGVWGPFADKRLSNGGERIALSDELDQVVDEVTYDDHEPWPEEPDGDGPSLELTNPDFDNNSPCSWSASAGRGTPGARNSRYVTGNIAPCITNVSHAPVFPTSTQTTTISAHVSDNGYAQFTATLHYRPQHANDYTNVVMVDQGNNFYAADIPPQPDGQYVEFYISAIDSEGLERIQPDGAPGGVSDETGLPVTVSYLYLTEDAPPSASLPLYRLLMTDENRGEITARDLHSNEMLDATFVYETEVFYNVGVRYRGESSRDFWPRPYRIKFRDAQEFQNRERYNLINNEMGRQAMAYDLFQRLGHLSSDTEFVKLYINGHFEGNYLSVEQVDNDFLKARLPDGENHGNLYRGENGADLAYRGDDPDSYRPNYVKKNNYNDEDYTDVISLTHALSESADETFRAEAEQFADMRQWLSWFAAQAVLDNHEGALWIGVGDDYFLYNHPIDERFVLLSWDHDATFIDSSHGIWEPNWYATEVVKRILNEPVYTRWYYRDIISIAENEFSEQAMIPLIDALPDVVTREQKEHLRNYVKKRITKLYSEVPNPPLSIQTHGGSDFATSQTSVTLEGECSPLRDVHVNGDPSGVAYPTPTTWRYTANLPARDNDFVISDGLHSYAITVYRDYFDGGTLAADLTLMTSRRPYEIVESVTVPDGVTLTIEPGVTLQFRNDRYIRVNEGGRLLAEGTRSAPIVFTRQQSGYWGGILLDRTWEDNRIRHAVIEYTREVISNPRSHGVSAYGARVTIADSVIRHTDFSAAVQTYPWYSYDPTIYLLRNEIYDIQRDAVHVTGGYAFIQGNHIYDVRHGEYEFEGIEVSHMDVATPAILLDNHIHDVSDDCLDLNHSSAIIERNRLHDCGDKGISIGHPSSTTLVNNLIYNCIGKDEDPFSGAGIAVKDGAVSRIVNQTISNCRFGINLYEGHEGEGGGSATVANTIAWGNDLDLNLDALSTVSVTYSNVNLVTETGTAVWPGEGNINADPRFRDHQRGNYRLHEDSPSVDSGAAEGAWGRAPDEDIIGVSRPHGEGHDMGAHEFFEFYNVYLPLTVRNK